MTPEQCQQKIDKHLQRGGGIYATGKGLGTAYYLCRVKEAVLQVWDSSIWINVPRGAQFKNGAGDNLFEYEDG